MKTIFSIFTLLVAIFAAYSQSGAIKGRVFDEKGNPQAYADVIVDNGSIPNGTITNSDGYYSVKPLPSGFYDVTIKFLGYSDVVIPNVYVKPDDFTFLKDVRMNPDGFIMDGIDIRPDYSSRDIDPTEGLKETLLPDELDRLPGNVNIASVLGSIVTGMSVSEDGKEIIFRGARPNTNAFYVDGVKVSDLDSGIPSAAYGSISVYSGGIPAKYGDLTGGVVVIETKSYFDVYNMRRARASR